MDNFHTIFQLTVSTLQRVYPQTKSGQISCYSRYMECYTFQRCIPPRFIIGRINTQVIPQHQIIIFQIQDTILSIQITRYKYYFYLRFRRIGHSQILHHIKYLIMTHIMQPMCDKRTLQRSCEILFAFQTFHQILTRIPYPTWYINKCQHLFFQIFITGQSVQGLQIDIDTFIFKLITTACTHNKSIIAHRQAKQFISQIQHRSTSFLTLGGKCTTLRNKVILKPIHQHHICRLVQQLLAFVVGNLTDRSKAIHMMRSLLLNRMLCLHIEFTRHLVAIISK